MTSIRPLTLFGILVCMPMLFFSCAGNTAPADTATARTGGVPVETTSLLKRDFTEYGEYYGKLEPASQAVLIAPGGGTVESIAVREGDLVAAGDSLGAVELEKAAAAYRVAELNERITAETFQRQKELLSRGNAARLTADQAELAWRAAHAELLEARRLLKGARCETPLSGTVLTRHMDQYDELVPGSPTFTVADTTEMRICVGIPEGEIAGVAPGNRAQVSFDMYPGEYWEGTVQELAGQVSPATLTFTAEILIHNSDGRLAPGITAEVKLARKTLSDQVVVPTEAVLNDGTESFVMVAEGDRARRYPVITGPADSGTTVIRSGLPAEAELIVAGNHLVSDGTTIRRAARKG